MTRSRTGTRQGIQSKLNLFVIFWVHDGCLVAEFASLLWKIQTILRRYFWSISDQAWCFCPFCACVCVCACASRGCDHIDAAVQTDYDHQPSGGPFTQAAAHIISSHANLIQFDGTTAGRWSSPTAAAILTQEHNAFYYFKHFMITPKRKTLCSKKNNNKKILKKNIIWGTFCSSLLINCNDLFFFFTPWVLQ